MIHYSISIEWSDWKGNRTAVSSTDDHVTADEAFAPTLDLAIRCGWTPPRWWHWWRWGEGYWHWSAEWKEWARTLMEANGNDRSDV